MRTRRLAKSRGVTGRVLAGSLIVLGLFVCTGLAQDQAGQATGELKIEGTHIVKLVLRGSDNQNRTWTDPNGSIRLRIGTYRIQQLELRGSRVCQTAPSLSPITVSGDTPAVLKAGGPLRQTIDVRRQGRILLLSYSLQGIGNERYAPSRLANERPTFTVYRGDKAIGAGTFEFG